MKPRGIPARKKTPPMLLHRISQDAQEDNRFFEGKYLNNVNYP
jgi:hypothetical protein